MTTDPFAKYRLPAGMMDTVAIPIPDTPAVFHVKLPSSFRDEYQASMMLEWTRRGYSTDTLSENASEFYRLQRDMFFEHCISGADGLPEGMGVSEFLDEYALIRKLLFDRAMDLASRADEEVNIALGKLQSSPTGKSSGRGKANNTKH